MAFAQLKPGELLRESERAMGDAHLQVLHEELTAERKDLLGYERVRRRPPQPCMHQPHPPWVTPQSREALLAWPQSAGALKRQLEEEEARMAELQRDRARFQQRRQLEDQARARPAAPHSTIPPYLPGQESLHGLFIPARDQRTWSSKKRFR